MSGVAPSRIAGDSCARTTWENATLTAAWLGLQVQPLALRETAATVLYRLQGRM
ncbi:hypothetical protein [Synechococcus sp. BA-132 BA5]|uniref:hypothetical protein n=1 Tax=Synechococcus sp. BA-132 BA5 TaxID=3110252 RepID=UPI002B1EAD18|nr:hypothetical protein [Synechococcus sp. BA-132 BA5]MEA5416266.1 hypothetical protein [Synechococcus sp. BA-132 BA5]